MQRKKKKLRKVLEAKRKRENCIVLQCCIALNEMNAHVTTCDHPYYICALHFDPIADCQIHKAFTDMKQRSFCS